LKYQLQWDIAIKNADLHQIKNGNVPRSALTSALKNRDSLAQIDEITPSKRNKHNKSSSLAEIDFKESLPDRSRQNNNLTHSQRLQTQTTMRQSSSKIDLTRTNKTELRKNLSLTRLSVNSVGPASQTIIGSIRRKKLLQKEKDQQNASY